MVSVWIIKMKYSNFHITSTASGNTNRGVCDFHKIILDFNGDWRTRLRNVHELERNNECNSAVSIQSLVLIAVDRFVAVVFPLRSPLFSSKLYRFFILATWIIAMATFIPYLVAFKLVEYDHEYKCVRQWMRVFDDSSSVTKYFMALFITSFYIFFLKLKSQRGTGEHSINAQIQRLRRERNALKLSIAIVLGFAVCWIPFSIFALVRMFADENNATMSCGFKQLLEQVALLLSRTNSAMNPCICFIFSGNYGQGLKNLLGCWVSCQG